MKRPRQRSSLSKRNEAKRGSAVMERGWGTPWVQEQAGERRKLCTGRDLVQKEHGIPSPCTLNSPSLQASRDTHSEARSVIPISQMVLNLHAEAASTSSD